MIITIYYVYPQTDYCHSTLFCLFLPISFIISIQLVKTFCSYSHDLLLQTDLLRVMVIKFPCGISLKPVANNHQAIKCDKCNLWIHIKCNKINKKNISTNRHLLRVLHDMYILRNFYPSQILMIRNLYKPL